MAKEEVVKEELIEVFLVNTGKTIKYIDVDGKKETKDEITLGPKGSAKVRVTQKRIDELKLIKNLVVKNIKTKEK